MKKSLLLAVIAFGVLTVCLYFYSDDRNFNFGDRPGEIFSDRYGKEFNKFRTENHLPIIEESWIIRIKDSTHIRWSHASTYNKQDTPEHIWKTLYFKDSALLAEEDAFNYDQGDSVGDRLIIVINFEHSDSTKFKFSRHYYKSYPPSQSVAVNFEFADSVLNKWGFKNLYSGVKPSIPRMQ